MEPDTYGLYDGTPPHALGSETSREAAEAVKPRAALLRARCLAVVEAAGLEGATCDEVEAATGLLHQSASARVRELVQLGAIVPNGARRQTRSGRSAQVYVTAVYAKPAPPANHVPGQLALPLDPWNDVPA